MAITRRRSPRMLRARIAWLVAASGMMDGDHPLGGPVVKRAVVGSLLVLTSLILSHAQVDRVGASLAFGPTSRAVSAATRLAGLQQPPPLTRVLYGEVAPGAGR